MTPSAKELTQLRADLDQGLSLPAEWYTDPAIYQIERDHIFRRTWQWVGRAEEVAAPGDYFTASSATSRSSWCGANQAL